MRCSYAGQGAEGLQVIFNVVSEKYIIRNNSNFLYNVRVQPKRKFYG